MEVCDSKSVVEDPHASWTMPSDRNRPEPPPSSFQHGGPPYVGPSPLGNRGRTRTGEKGQMHHNQNTIEASDSICVDFTQVGWNSSVGEALQSVNVPDTGGYELGTACAGHFTLALIGALGFRTHAFSVLWVFATMLGLLQPRRSWRRRVRCPHHLYQGHRTSTRRSPSKRESPCRRCQ
jgi:hypothetical protein